MGIYGGVLSSKRTWSPNYGDGSDGSLTWTSITVAKQTYQCTDMTLPNGVTVTLANAYLPHIWRCQGTLTINGTIDGTGKGHRGGGYGYARNNNYGGRAGSGPGGGRPGHNQNVTFGVASPTVGGGGAGHATAGGDASDAAQGFGVGGPAYDALGSLLRGIFGPDWAGSGGGEGAGTNATVDDSVGIGGDGGPGWVAIARKIVLGSTAVITLNGANGGGAGCTNCGYKYGGGGAGSGGIGALIAEVIELPSSGTIITATGGSGGPGAGTSTGNGGNGAPGWIYLVPLKAISPADAANRSNPVATVLKLIPTMALA